MKKYLMLLTLLLVVAMALVACGGAEEEAPAEPEEAAPAEEAQPAEEEAPAAEQVELTFSVWGDPEELAILPLYHPVRVAEDVAQLDVMSGGRAILGVAIGYRPEEFAAFQTALDGRGRQFVEMIELIKRLWAEDEVTFEGERYHLSHFSLEPKPVQQPRPPIWIGGWGKLALKRAAYLADAWIPGPTANLAKLKEAQAGYQEHLAELGIDPHSRARPLTRDVIIAPSQQEAEAQAERYLLAAYRDEYSDWEHPLIGAADSTATDKLSELRRDRFIIGDPESAAEQIRHFETQFGMDHLICRLHFPGMPPEMVTEAIRLIGQEVIPAFSES